MPITLALRPRRRFVRPLVTAIAAAAGAAAWAADDPSPYYIGVSQAITHDSNAGKVANGGSDTYSTTGVNGGFDQGIGRQRVHAAANVAYNKYRNQTGLDNVSYGVNAGWDWATIEQLSGNVNVSANQSLANLNGNATAPTTGRNLVKTDQVSTGVRWGGAGALSVSADYGHSRVDYSAPEYFASKSSADTASVGLNYRVGPSVGVGTAVRFTRTRTPYAVLNANATLPLGPDDYSPNTATGRNLDLSASWTATAQTGLNVRVSWTNQTNSVPGQDFSGLTGALSASYAPTAKLGFSATLSRDAGNNGTYFNSLGTTTSGVQIGVVSGNTQTTDAVSLGASYAATAKIGVNAGLTYRRAKVVSTLDAGGGLIQSTEQNDNYRVASLGASWAIARAWQLGCNVSHESRSLSNTSGADYSANIVSCNAQLTLR